MQRILTALALFILSVAAIAAPASAAPKQSVTTQVSWPYQGGKINAKFIATPLDSEQWAVSVSFKTIGVPLFPDSTSPYASATGVAQTTVSTGVLATIEPTLYSGAGLFSFAIPLSCTFSVGAKGKVTVYDMHLW